MKIHRWCKNAAVPVSCFKVCLLTQVLPNMASIEDINAISYSLCGLVRMADGGLKAKVCIFSTCNFFSNIFMLKLKLIF